MPSESLSHIDFWDVGQGDCSVLNFTDGSILIIDTGPKGSPLVDWLADKPRSIAAIVLTHNDADHAGALCSIVASHKSRIGAVYMLQDRNAQSPSFQKLFRCALQGEIEGYYHITRLEVPLNPNIWTSQDLKTKLVLVHPTYSEATLATTPNDTSALLVLEHESKWLAIWPGDLSLGVLSSKAGGRDPYMLMGPHHGAPSGYKVKPDSISQVASVSPRRAFISVGTSNGYSHPRPRYLDLLGRAGCLTSCSQITRMCDTKFPMAAKPVFNGTAMLGLRAPRGGVACRGAMRLFFDGEELLPDNNERRHFERVADLRRPQCLRSLGWKKGESADLYLSALPHDAAT